MGASALSRPDRVADVSARRLDIPLRRSFDIAGGSHARVANVLVTAVLEDGTRGYGECAPMPAFNGETQDEALAAVRRGTLGLRGLPVGSSALWSAAIGARTRRCRSALAGIEMALLDAGARRAGIPLRALFGGAGDRVTTDVTIPIVPPDEACRTARRLWRWGIRTLKIKVGRDLTSDLRRIEAAVAGAPRARLILDANAGYRAPHALEFLARLRRLGIRPALFEQPTAARDWAGLREVHARGGVPVAADESASCRADVLRLARTRSVQVVNIKLMKYGVLESLEVARVARAGGLGLMIGGLIESRLAMSCAAHLAAGFGGFSFVDLDTPLFLAADPMRGPRILRGGVYDLSGVRAGIGVTPKDGTR
ncbi:MAG: hypothetical protein A2X36_06830 [Elusimicrobia bacterium GWA2_69_24]|nr:MAG: hypothetical protein A2X36_06830 [Elusimicrobia bacterium GWA2_69_24]HBL15882.1 dipeptide epimerase [Elusimicrobiota bacterium]